MNNKKSYKNLFIFLLIGIICALITLYLYAQNVHKKSLETIVNETYAPHILLNKEINLYKAKRSQMVEMLSSHSHFKSYFENNDKTQLQNLFSSIAKSDRDYMQLRFIDINGQEQIRVDQDKKGNVKIIQDADLQNKAHRDYFIDFMKLSKNNIGFSQFDLNIEHKKVEVPFNPTMRIGRKVYYNDQLVGVVIMNLYTQSWTNDLLDSFKIFMVDSKGNFKIHFDPQWAWSGYQDPPKKAETNSTYHNLNNWQIYEQPYYILSDTTIGRVIDFFGEKVLVGYVINSSIKDLLLENIFQLTLALFISGFFVFIPILMIIRKSFDNIKQSEQFKERVFDNMFDALIVNNSEGLILDINTQALHLLGYSKDELLGKNIQLLIPTLIMEDQIKEMHNINAVHHDKSMIPIAIGVTKMALEEQHLYITIARDLREIKKLEEENKKQENLLQHQSKLASMGEMIGAIAHQWRQPLNELSIRMQKIKIVYKNEQITPEYIEEFVEKNKQTILFMSKTIDDFRNFFRIDKTKSEFDVKSAVESVINMQSAQLDDNNITLQLDLHPCSFLGHKSEFQQVVLNIINNAKDALVDKMIDNPTIIIKLNNNILSIEDNAGGIPEELINKIFEPYFTTKDQGEGTGLGLYMSKIIIENNMHSQLLVENGLRGAIFTIKLKS